jgi:hypothetical protein
MMTCDPLTYARYKKKAIQSEYRMTPLFIDAPARYPTYHIVYDNTFDQRYDEEFTHRTGRFSVSREQAKSWGRASDRLYMIKVIPKGRK